MNEAILILYWSNYAVLIPFLGKLWKLKAHEKLKNKNIFEAQFGIF